MRRWGVGAALAVVALGGRAAEMAPNLARTAVVTGSEEGPAGYELRRAVDGDPSTRWGGAKSDRAWLDFAWKAPVAIRRVALCEWGRHLQKVAVQTVGADGWQTVATVKRAADPETAVTAIALPKPLTTKHIRLLMDGRAISLYEVRLSGAAAVALTGAVTDARTRAPVAGAMVTALPGRAATRSDARGRYRLDLEPGTYTVSAERPIGGDGRGYAARSAAVRVAAGGTARNFRLDPVRGVLSQLEGVVPLTASDPLKTDAIPIPLDVPEGVARMTVKLLDLQPALGPARPGGGIEPFYRAATFTLFDPRGVGPEGFRGTGMNRNSLTAVLSPASASPGFVAGPIPAGRWTLLCRSGKDSVDMRYRFAVTFQMGPSAPARPAPKRSTAALDPGPNWFKGDFHAHTSHSVDASLEMKRLIADRRAAGYDFVAIADHNTVSGHAEAARLAGDDKPLVILGEEVTTDFGSLSVLDATPGWWADFRIQPGDDSLPRLIDAAHAAGGRIAVNRPESPLSAPARFGWDPKMDVLEAFTGDDAATEEILKAADRMYAQRRHVPLIAGSGIHHAGQAGGPVTWVYADDLSAKSIMNAATAGHAVMTRGFDDALFTIEADADGDGKFEASVGDKVTALPDRPIKLRARVAGYAGKTLRIVTAAGVQVLPFDPSFDWVEFWQDEHAQFIRAEIVDPRPAGPPRYEALTNPIYLH